MAHGTEFMAQSERGEFRAERQAVERLAEEETAFAQQMSLKTAMMTWPKD